MDISDLKQHGVANIKYYYEKSNILSNVYTVCLFISPDKELLARGISICSVMDQHKKSDGRKKSKDRAIKALMEKVTQLPINSNREKFFEVKNTFKMIDEKTTEYAKKAQDEASLNRLSYHEYNHNGTNYIQITVPSWLPIAFTEVDFSHKSYFKPIPTEKENSIIEGKKEKEVV